MSSRRRDPGDDPLGLRKIGDSLQDVTRRLGMAPPATLTAIFTHWDQIVGELLAAHVRPIGLFEHNLTVEVDDPAWAAQLRFLGGDLMDRVNESVGPDTVRELTTRIRRPGSRRPQRPSSSD